MIRTILNQEQWERIAPELPGKVGDPGATAADNRLFVEAVVNAGAKLRQSAAIKMHHGPALAHRG